MCAGTASGDVVGPVTCNGGYGVRVELGGFIAGAQGSVGGATFTVTDHHYAGGGIRAELRASGGTLYKSLAAAGMIDMFGRCTLGPSCCESETTKHRDNCRLTGEQLVRLFPWDDSQMFDGGTGGSLMLDGGYVDLNLSY